MKKSITMLLVAMLLCGASTKAFSWGGGHYQYRGGHYYGNVGWFGFGALVTGLAVGAYVASLPPDYDTVVIGGVPYYESDGYYYQSGPNGYVVVTPPVSQGQTAPSENNGMVYILGTLFGVVLLLGIGFLLKKLLGREAKPA